MTESMTVYPEEDLQSSSENQESDLGQLAEAALLAIVKLDKAVRHESRKNRAHTVEQEDYAIYETLNESFKHKVFILITLTLI